MLSFASIETKLGNVSDMVSDAWHQKPCQNTTSQQVQHNLQHNKKRSSFATFQPIEASQSCLYNSIYVPSNLIGESNNLYNVQKKPRFAQQQVMQQRWQQGTRMQLENHNSVSTESIQQQRLQSQQRQQFQQSVLGVQQAQLQQKHCMQQKGMQRVQSYDGDVYTHRLIEYMRHKRNRPPDNDIAYWRKLVENYYARTARKRCCFSLCNDVEDCVPGVHADEVTGPWPCCICGSKSGRRSEAVFEDLPSLFQSEFGSGILDEMLSLDLQHEPRINDGITIVEYERAVLHRICRESRVVHEGLLRVVFTQDLKILSWQFCFRRHEELVPCRLLKPMVSNVIKLSEYCQSLDAVTGSEGNPEEMLQATYHMLEHVYLIQNTLGHPRENELGIPKTYFQGVELSCSAGNLGDITDFCQKYKPGPVESLQNYPQPLHAVTIQKQKMQEMEVWQSSAQGLFANFNMLKNSTMHSGLNTSVGAFPVDVSGGGLVGNGHSTPGTHESGIAMEPDLSWTNGWEPISDNAFILV